MSNAPKRTRYTSPKGIFRFPKLTEPDTKFKAEGEYSVGLILSADDAAAIGLMRLIDTEAAASLANAKANAKTPAEAKRWETKYLPYSPEEDRETGEPTGNVIFKFSMKASGVSKKTGKPWERKPVLFDAKGMVIKGGINIGGGTTGKVSFEVIPYAATTQSGASVKLALEAAQIIELRSFGEQSASSFGFGEEDGYEAPATSAGFSDETTSTISDDDEIPF
jgi:hypothetical protein